MKKALIIDGNNILFKAYYATAQQGVRLHSLEGLPTNALYAFIRMMKRFLTDNHYDAVFVAFDAGKKTFRNEKFIEYKAKRLATPEELVPQFGLVRHFLDLAKIKWAQISNYEADDLIGTIIQQADAKNFQIDIISSDKDLYQVLAPNVTILAPKTGLSEIKTVNLEVLKTEFGLIPSQIPDYKGLIGDNSDNLPGIRGIGPKTASKLLEKYHDLETIIDHLKDLTPKEQTLITNSKDAGLMTKELATLTLDAPLSLTLTDCLYQVEQLANDKLQDFYHQYNMKSLIKKVQASTSIVKSNIAVLTKWNPSFNEEHNYIWFEVNEANYHFASLTGISIKNDNGLFFCDQTMLETDQDLRTFLSSKQYQKTTWDIKKSLIICESQFKLALKGLNDDLMLGCYLLNANEKISLTNMARIYDEAEQFLVDDNLFYGKGAKKQTRDPVDIAEHLAMKVNLLAFLKPIIDQALSANHLFSLYQTIELPTAFALAIIEQNGIQVDLNQLKTMADETNQKLIKLEAEINQIAGITLNPNSPKQVSDYLFNQLKLPNYKKNSTAFEVLMVLQNKHPIIKLLLEYRKLQKLYGTYLIGLQRFIADDGKIHTIYHQAEASTGRLSSSDPNMQNITIRNEEQRLVRKVFVASKPNYQIVAFDYSQIELRVLADISADQALIKAFLDNKDIHADTASKIFNVPLNEVTSQQRSQAKAVNFGIVYGISGFGLAQQLKISQKQAQTFIDKYFTVFPAIKDYIKDTIAFCVKHQFVETMFHRKRTVPEITSHNRNLKDFGERIAMNMPIQGTAADIIKLAMIAITDAIAEKKVKGQLIAQVHDELIFEIAENDVKKMITTISKLMSNVVKLKVPLVVNSSSGNNWYELKS